VPAPDVESPTPTLDLAAGLEARSAGPVAPTDPVVAAESDLASLEAGIRAEDAPRGGHPKSRTVAAQVATPLDAARKAHDAMVGAPKDRGLRAAFVSAVATLKTAYLASSLQATDTDAQGAWTADQDRLELPASAGALRTLQSRSGGFVKFAIPAGSPGTVRVGNPGVYAHGQVAGGDALAAGLVVFAFHGDDVTVGELENTSGGFRPGPLRNATAVSAFEAAGYTVARVHANPDGTYDHSDIDPR
jgi:hypothetical protein